MRARFRKAELSGDSLAGVRVLRDLDAGERQRVAGYCEGRRYPCGAEIVAHGGQNRDVFLIVSGRVSTSVLSPGGRRITFQALGAGDTFGELAWIDAEVRATSVVAVQETFVARIPSRAFGEILDTYPSVSHAVMRRLTGLVRHLCERVYELHTLNVKERICVELYRMAEAEGTFLTENSMALAPAPRHVDIASRVGTIRESVTRVLRDLARARIVQREDGKLVIRDLAALEGATRRAWSAGPEPSIDSPRPAGAPVHCVLN